MDLTWAPLFSTGLTADRPDAPSWRGPPFSAFTVPGTGRVVLFRITVGVLLLLVFEFCPSQASGSQASV